MTATVPRDMTTGTTGLDGATTDGTEIIDLGILLLGVNMKMTADEIMIDVERMTGPVDGMKIVLKERDETVNVGAGAEKKNVLTNGLPHLRGLCLCPKESARLPVGMFMLQGTSNTLQSKLNRLVIPPMKDIIYR